jgi:histone-lysine N-methyltransferase SETD1
MMSVGARNLSNLTPLTNAESSPLRFSSPNHSTTEISAITSSALASEQTHSLAQNDVAQTKVTATTHSNLRIHARDPARGIKGNICTYDPLLDRTPNLDGKKKTKPTYKEFGLVRIILVGERRLTV